MHDFVYLFLNIFDEKNFHFSLGERRTMLAALSFIFGHGERREKCFVDGIVPINILFKLHAFEKTVEAEKERKANKTSSRRA